jgi:hypothetical protein
VAVFAFNRATDFTTDHEKMARVIERFKRGHEGIEADLGHHFGGLAAMFRGPEIPASTQARIDDGSAASRPGFVRSRQGASPRRTGSVTTDALERRDMLRDREGGVPEDTEEGDQFDVSFYVFASTSVRVMHDLGNLYTRHRVPAARGGREAGRPTRRWLASTSRRGSATCSGTTRRTRRRPLPPDRRQG